MNKIKQSDPDFYFEHIYKNKNRNHDTAKTRSVFKPKELEDLKKSHDYWENARLKAWSESFQESKRKRSSESFEYLL